MTPEIYNVAEARKIMGIGNNKIYQLINSGQLKARKLGRRTLITGEAISDCLEGMPLAGDTA